MENRFGASCDSSTCHAHLIIIFLVYAAFKCFLSPTFPLVNKTYWTNILAICDELKFGRFLSLSLLRSTANFVLKKIGVSAIDFNRTDRSVGKRKISCHRLIFILIKNQPHIRVDFSQFCESNMWFHIDGTKIGFFFKANNKYKSWTHWMFCSTARNIVGNESQIFRSQIILVMHALWHVFSYQNLESSSKNQKSNRAES